MPEIYSPAEDSYFLSEVLKKNIKNYKINILDMGSGSGIQAQTLIDLGINPKNITLVDINPKSISFLKKKFSKSKIIKSNLFSNIKGKFELIVFNPPYLPEHKYDKQPDTSGGKKGSEIINKFLHRNVKLKSDFKDPFLIPLSFHCNTTFKYRRKGQHLMYVRIIQ